MSHRTQRVRIGEVRLKMGDLSSPTIQSKLRFDELTRRFETFVQKGFGIEYVDEVTVEIVERFVRAKGNTGEPALATMHIRRAAIRMLFRIARLEFGCTGDPTLDLALPPRTVLTTRPLEEDEVVLGRSYSQKTFTATRQPAAWALGEATATTAEMPFITIDDLELDCSDAHASGCTAATSASIVSACSTTGVQRRSSVMRRVSKDTRNLIYNGKSQRGFAAQISCCNAIKETLVRAGLDREADIRPASLAAYAGRVVLAESDSIEETARRLGIRSLDAAAAFINYTW
jgi:integrase/recombinase XerC